LVQVHKTKKLRAARGPLYRGEARVNINKNPERVLTRGEFLGVFRPRKEKSVGTGSGAGLLRGGKATKKNPTNSRSYYEG